MLERASSGGALTTRRHGLRHDPRRDGAALTGLLAVAALPTGARERVTVV
jgi:hypothetical protein